MYNTTATAKVSLAGEITKADGRIIKCGELNVTWRGWPVIKQVRQFWWHFMRKTERVKPLRDRYDAALHWMHDTAPWKIKRSK